MGTGAEKAAIRLPALVGVVCVALVVSFTLTNMWTQSLAITRRLNYRLDWTAAKRELYPAAADRSSALPLAKTPEVVAAEPTTELCDLLRLNRANFIVTHHKPLCVGNCHHKKVNVSDEHVMTVNMQKRARFNPMHNLHNTVLPTVFFVQQCVVPYEGEKKLKILIPNHMGQALSSINEEDPTAKQEALAALEPEYWGPVYMLAALRELVGKHRIELAPPDDDEDGEAPSHYYREGYVTSGKWVFDMLFHPCLCQMDEDQENCHQIVGAGWKHISRSVRMHYNATAPTPALHEALMHPQNDRLEPAQAPPRRAALQLLIYRRADSGVRLWSSAQSLIDRLRAEEENLNVNVKVVDSFRLPLPKQCSILSQTDVFLTPHAGANGNVACMSGHASVVEVEKSCGGGNHHRWLQPITSSLGIYRRVVSCTFHENKHYFTVNDDEVFEAVRDAIRAARMRLEHIKV